MIVLDACILIALFSPQDAGHEAAKDVLATNEMLMISSITLAQALVLPARTGSLDKM